MVCPPLEHRLRRKAPPLEERVQLVVWPGRTLVKADVDAPRPTGERRDGLVACEETWGARLGAYVPAQPPRGHGRAYTNVRVHVQRVHVGWCMQGGWARPIWSLNALGALYVNIHHVEHARHAASGQRGA